jgi:hypothetical protein
MDSDDPEDRITELERQLAEQKRIAELERQLAEAKAPRRTTGRPAFGPARDRHPTLPNSSTRSTRPRPAADGRGARAVGSIGLARSSEPSASASAPPRR